MSLTNEQQERFQILLQQLQIPDDLINQYLQGGGIERLVIDKANKSWHFDLQVPRILPTELYELLETKLKQSFSHIARTTFALETENKQFTEEEVRAYWPLCTERITFSPMFAYLKKRLPQVNGVKLLINVNNELESTALKKNVAKPVGINTKFLIPAFSVRHTYTAKYRRNAKVS